MLRPVCLLALASLAACGTPEGHGQSGAPPDPGLSSPAEGSAAEASAPGDSALEESATAPLQERLPPPGEAWVIFGSDTVHAEVARTLEEREQGLMYREELPEKRGMFFVFPDLQVRSFWMKNTFIPLDIAYLDAELRILDIQPMEPETTDPHPSAEPAMFALEVPLGWFAKMGISVGDQARVIFGPG